LVCTLAFYDNASLSEAHSIPSDDAIARRLDSLRQLDWASRDLRRRHKQLEAATGEVASELQRPPTEAELAAKLGVDIDRFRHMMLDLRNSGLVSASRMFLTGTLHSSIRTVRTRRGCQR
jgi:DNA-directed RNA polymerase specialized sigma subunit